MRPSSPRFKTISLDELLKTPCDCILCRVLSPEEMLRARCITPCPRDVRYCELMGLPYPGLYERVAPAPPGQPPGPTWPAPPIDDKWLSSIL